MPTLPTSNASPRLVVDPKLVKQKGASDLQALLKQLYNAGAVVDQLARDLTPHFTTEPENMKQALGSLIRSVNQLAAALKTWKPKGSNYSRRIEAARAAFASRTRN